MWYEKTKQGFIRVYSDASKPLSKERGEVPKYTLAQRVVEYSRELKTRRVQIKELEQKNTLSLTLIKNLKEENLQLRKEIQALKSNQKVNHVSDISLSSLINEVGCRTKDKAKLSIFQDIIKDNLEIRKNIGEVL